MGAPFPTAKPGDELRITADAWNRIAAVVEAFESSPPAGEAAGPRPVRVECRVAAVIGDLTPEGSANPSAITYDLAALRRPELNATPGTPGGEAAGQSVFLASHAPAIRASRDDEVEVYPARVGSPATAWLMPDGAGGTTVWAQAHDETVIWRDCPESTSESGGESGGGGGT